MAAPESGLRWQADIDAIEGDMLLPTASFRQEIHQRHAQSAVKNRILPPKTAKLERSKSRLSTRDYLRSAGLTCPAIYLEFPLRYAREWIQIATRYNL